MGSDNWASILYLCSSDEVFAPYFFVAMYFLIVISIYQVRGYIKKLPIKKQREMKDMLPSSGGYRENNELIDLLKQLLIFKPEKRIKAAESLSHPFFKALHDPLSEIDADFTYDDRLTFEHTGMSEVKSSQYELFLISLHIFFFDRIHWYERNETADME